MADYSELKRKAQEIRDEVKAGANTANRVGLALEDTVKALEAENQRAEEAEISLENAVQMLQDETEDLPSIRERLDTLVVNDLTTGGADKALSAEMGKDLGEELTELGERADDLEDAMFGKQLIPIESTILKGYCQSNTKKYVNINNDEVLYGFRVFQVESGKKYNFTGTLFNDGYSAYSKLIFTSSLPSNGDTAELVILNSSAKTEEMQSMDITWVAPKNGYILSWTNSVERHLEICNEIQITGSKLEQFSTRLSSIESKSTENEGKVNEALSKVETLENQLISKELRPISNVSKLNGAYVSRDNYKITESSSTAYGLDYIHVSKGDKVRIYGTFKGYEAYASVVFSKVEPAGNVQTTSIKDYAANETFDLTYIAEEDGYVAAWWFSNPNLYSWEKSINKSRIDVLDKRIEDVEQKIKDVGSQSSSRPKINVVCSGSSITWGAGSLDDSMVKYVDEYLKHTLATTVMCNEMIFSTDATNIANDILHKSIGKKITGVGSKVEFDLFGDEIAICQAKMRVNDYGIFKVYADGVQIGIFDNKNEIKSNSEEFSGSTLKKIRLAHPCTFNHSIRINGSTTLTNVVINTQGYGATIPSDVQAFVYRGLDDNGNPTHFIEFAESLGTITSASVSYNYGRIVGHEKSNVGQLADGLTNESKYGTGTVSYDPANPTGGISSGQEFRYIDKDAFFVYKFTESKKRHFVVEIAGGSNPYLVVNFATNRYHNLMNAGIGGWTISALIDNNKVCDLQQFFKAYKPDIIFQESSTNDDWQSNNRRLARDLGEKTLDELKLMSCLELSSVAYNSSTQKYAIKSACGIISSITPFSLTSNDIKGSDVAVGDIARIGTYHGDIKQVVCRKVKSVDLANGTITWAEPIYPEQMLNVESLSNLVGAEVNIRSLDGYKAKYKTFIENVREVAPHCKIVIVDSGLSNFGIRQLWGYDIIHQDLCNEYYNVEYCNIRDWLYDYMFGTISGVRTESVTSNGGSSYDLAFSSANKSWQGFKVLVDGVDVYGKDCYIENYYMYHADGTKTGASLNKSDAGSHPSGYSTTNTRAMKLVFTKNAPASGKIIEIWYADNLWSSDYCHPNPIGAFAYSQMYCKHI